MCQEKCQMIDVPPMKDCDFETKCENVKIPYTVKEAYCSWEDNYQEEMNRVPVAPEVLAQSLESLEIFDMPY